MSGTGESDRRLRLGRRRRTGCLARRPRCRSGRPLREPSWFCEPAEELAPLDARIVPIDRFLRLALPERHERDARRDARGMPGAVELDHERSGPHTRPGTRTVRSREAGRRPPRSAFRTRGKQRAGPRAPNTRHPGAPAAGFRNKAASRSRPGWGGPSTRSRSRRDRPCSSSSCPATPAPNRAPGLHAECSPGGAVWAGVAGRASSARSMPTRSSTRSTAHPSPADYGWPLCWRTQP